MRDPVTNEIGKTIIFVVSQNHAARIAQLLNEYSDKLFPGKYNSDFAVQVTSAIHGAQQMTINFTNNNLNGRSEFDPLYQTSKTRVCVTVGMMTTGYNCPDLLNVCLMRPIFSPSDFVQIKGRGTRKHNFTIDMRDRERAKDLGRNDKTVFRLFDFFANCEFFEETFDYDAKIELPVEKPKDNESTIDTGGGVINIDEFDSKLADELRACLKSPRSGRLLIAPRFIAGLSVSICSSPARDDRRFLDWWKISVVPGGTCIIGGNVPRDKSRGY
jgi:type I restriction enzyme R subunit